MDLLQTLCTDDNRLLQQVCRQLGRESTACSVEPVTQHSNLNHVVRLFTEDGSYYIKQSPETPLGPQVSVPASRNQYEAQAVELAATLAVEGIATPRCVYIDRDHHFFVTDAVSETPVMLVQQNYKEFSYLRCRGPQLAGWLAEFHRMVPLSARPADQTRLLQTLLYTQILAMGINNLFPRDAEKVLQICTAHSDSLVHGDLWGKNFVKTAHGDLGIVDFEGAMPGDGAGDIAAIWCSALFCCLESRSAMEQWCTFCEDFQKAYCATYGNSIAQFWPRVGAHMILLLCHRVAGMFPYLLSEEQKFTITRAVQQLLNKPDLLPQEVVECIHCTYLDAPRIAV